MLDKAGKGRSKDGKGAANKLAHRYLWTPLEDEVLIIYVKKLRPSDYYGVPESLAKQTAWDRVAEAFNTEFVMWKQQYPSINLTVNKRDGKSCRSRWKYHVSLARTRRGEKIPMSEAEDEYIIYMQQKLNNKWSLISAELTAYFGVYRTDNDVKNRWNSKLQHIVRRRRLGGVPPRACPPPPPEEPIAPYVDVKGPNEKPTVESRLDTLKPSKTPISSNKWPSAGRLEQLLDVPHAILQRLKDIRNSGCEEHELSGGADQHDNSTCSSGEGMVESMDAFHHNAQSLLEDVKNAPEHVKELLKSSGLLNTNSSFMDPQRKNNNMHRAHSLPGSDMFTHCNNAGVMSTGHVEEWEGLEATRNTMQRASSAHPRAFAAALGGGKGSRGAGAMSSASLQRAMDLLLKKVEDEGQMGQLSRHLSTASDTFDHGASRSYEVDPETSNLTLEVQQLLAGQNDLMAQLNQKKLLSPVATGSDLDSTALDVEELLAGVDTMLGTHDFGASPGVLIKHEPELDNLLSSVDHMDFNVDNFWT